MAVSGEASALELRMAKALSHPLRRVLLARYLAAERSPSDLAAELDASLGDVAYHTTRLRDLGWITETRTKQVRGATKHYYRATAYDFDDASFAAIPTAARRGIVARILSEVIRDAGEGVEAPNLHTSRIVLTLDEEAVSEVAKLLEGIVGRLAVIERRSADRNPEQGELWEVAIVGFPLRDAGDRGTADPASTGVEDHGE